MKRPGNVIINSPFVVPQRHWQQQNDGTLALIEGRVELVQLRPGGYAWRATWAQPLPRYATKGTI